VGAAVGYGASQATAPPTQMPGKDETVSRADVPIKPVDDLAVGRTVAATGPRLPPQAVSGSPRGATPAGATATPNEVAELKALIATLNNKLVDAQADLEARSGPLIPPEHLPDRFSQKAIIEALTSALKETASSAQLSSVDCTEYPCIAYFDSLTAKDLDALKHSTAYGAYAHDRFITFSRVGPDGPYDGVVAMPSNDTNARNDVSARVRFRMGQMLP
jgi:hypothetical protein